MGAKRSNAAVAGDSARRQALSSRPSEAELRNRVEAEQQMRAQAERQRLSEIAQKANQPQPEAAFPAPQKRPPEMNPSLQRFSRGQDIVRVMNTPDFAQILAGISQMKSRKNPRSRF